MIRSFVVNVMSISRAARVHLDADKLLQHFRNG